jgi:hypothetical protein
MKKQITQNEYYQIYALKILISEKYKEIESISNIVHKIFGTNPKNFISDDTGWVDQLTWDNDLSLDEIIEKFNIKIKNNRESKKSKKTKKTIA